MKIEDISKTENQMIIEAVEQYGKYFVHAQFAVNFMDSFLSNVSSKAAFFMLFFSQIKKHIILAFLSAIRLHHVQATFDFRYATEAGAWAAFAMAHYKPEEFAESKNNGTLDSTENHRKRMYSWLEKNYPSGNKSVKRFKGTLNKLSTHANIVDAYRNFNGITQESVNISLFDKSEEHHVKTDLWTVGNLVMGLLDLFYGVNRDYKVLGFQNDFLSQMAKLKTENDFLKTEMMSHPRLKRYAKKE